MEEININKNCIKKAEDLMCPKEYAESHGMELKKLVDGEINPFCALCSWYDGYIQDEEIRKIRNQLYMLAGDLTKIALRESLMKDLEKMRD